MSELAPDEIREALHSVEGQPNTILLPMRTYVAWMRRTMTKRRFRRWRGKWRAYVAHERRRQAK